LHCASEALMADGMVHLSEATWDQLAAAELGAAARDAAFDHVVSCERCSLIWRGILGLQSEAQAQGLIAPVAPAQRNWLRSPAFLLPLAATLVVAIGGIMLLRRPAPDQATMRGAARIEVQGLAATVGVDGVATLSWAPLAGANRYRIDVFSNDGHPVWTREVDAPPVRWPDDEPRIAGSYRWRVEAMNAGVVVARSRLSGIEVGR
ncbi:MAG: hypothetical protein ABI665_07380, partial [Vicinamibacterales bacterium]